MDLSGKHAVVTGASRGIGLAIVEALADAGARVAGGARNISPELRKAATTTLEVDLTTVDGPAALIETAQEALGGIDILINNVGGIVGAGGGFTALSDEDWQRTFELTFFSTVRTTRAALPALLDGGGSVVNISSINARLAIPRLIAYSAAKAALSNLGKALAEEYAKQGLRVNTISPGPVLTDIWTGPGGAADGLARSHGISRDEAIARLPELTGLTTGRITAPSEVAAMVVFLASDLAPNVSGSDWVIDGGRLKQV